LAADFLSSSQPILLGNTNASDDSFGVDHYQFSDTTANNGRHKIIHQTTLVGGGPLNRTRSGPSATTANFPSQIAGINQVLAANYTPDYSGSTSDTQLFALTGNNGLSQLTGNDAETDGWQWIGGVLFQWGVVTSSASTTQTVTFKDRGPSNKGIPFPNNIFSITATVFKSTLPLSSSPAAVYILNDAGVTSPKKDQFQWRYLAVGGTGVPDGFYWMAIGN